jgi:hypothetical protein
MGPKSSFAQAVLLDLAPQEAEFFEDYALAVDGLGKARELGPQFGVELAAAIGPIAVWIAQRVWDRLASWAAETTGKIVQGYLVDRGKDLLKGWLSSPKDKTLAAALSADGKAEIVALAAKLAASSKLAPAEGQRIVQVIARRLFGA